MSAAMTKKELASIAGYTYRRLYDIDRALPQERKLFVENDDGKFDLATFVQRWVAYNVANESANIEDLDVVKARHEVVKTQKTELEVARMRGLLVDVQDVKKLWGDIANAVTQNMIRLPSKIAPRIRMMEDAGEIAGIIEEEIRTVLEEVAEVPLPEYASEETESPEEEEDE